LSRGRSGSGGQRGMSFRGTGSRQCTRRSRWFRPMHSFSDATPSPPSSAGRRSLFAGDRVRRSRAFEQLYRRYHAAHAGLPVGLSRRRACRGRGPGRLHRDPAQRRNLRPDARNRRSGCVVGAPPRDRRLRANGKHASKRADEERRSCTWRPARLADQVVDRDSAAQLKALLQLLPETQREVVTLAFYGQLSPRRDSGQARTAVRNRQGPHASGSAQASRQHRGGQDLRAPAHGARERVARRRSRSRASRGAGRAGRCLWSRCLTTSSRPRCTASANCGRPPRSRLPMSISRPRSASGCSPRSHELAHGARKFARDGDAAHPGTGAHNLAC